MIHHYRHHHDYDDDNMYDNDAKDVNVKRTDFIAHAEILRMKRVKKSVC